MAALLGATTMTLRRYDSPVTWVAGERVLSSTSDSSIVASFQPLRGREREELPEGFRSGQTAKLYSRTELNVVDLATETPGDLIIREGVTYWVFAAADWTDHARPTQHYKYLLSEVGEDQSL
jgi:hypothetical protein